MLHNRVPGGLRQCLLRDLLLKRRHGHRACEHCQRLGCTTNPQHDAEKHREDPDRLIIHLVHVADEFAPSVQVGELLHDPEGVDVVLREVGGDRPDHRKTTGKARRKRHGR